MNQRRWRSLACEGYAGVGERILLGDVHGAVAGVVVIGELHLAEVAWAYEGILAVGCEQLRRVEAA